MATYYVDPDAGGDDNGTDWTNAWTTLQRAIDGDGVGGTQPAAGDTVYCRGTETLDAACDVDGNSGTVNTGFIKYVGCNASGSVDGTRYVMDATDTYVSCLDTFSASHIWFENFQFTQATDDGVDLSGGGDNLVFVNCVSDNHGGAG